MSQAILDVLINPKGARDGAAQVKSALTSMSQTARSATQQMEQRFNSLKASLFSIRTAVLGMGIGLVVRDTLQLGMALERSERQLRAVTTSAAAARLQLERIREIADKFQIFDDQSLTNSFRLLAANGIKDAEGALETIANAAVQTGVDVETATTAVIAAQERQLRQLGVQLIDLGTGKMLIAFGNIRMEVQKTDQAMREGLLQVLSKGFPSASNAMGNSMEFQFARVKDAFEDFQVAVMRGGLQDFLTALAKTIADTFSNEEIAAGGKAFADDIIASLETIAKAAAYTYDALTPLGRLLFSTLKSALDAWGKLPPEIQAMGIIGTLWFGKRGAAILIGALALMDKMNDETTNVAKNLKNMSQAAGDSAAGQGLMDMFTALGLGHRKNEEPTPREAKMKEMLGNILGTSGQGSQGGGQSLAGIFGDTEKNLDSMTDKTTGFFQRLKGNFAELRKDSQQLAKDGKNAGSLLKGGGVDENAEKVRAQMEWIKGNLQEQIGLEAQKRDLAFSPERADAEKNALEAIQSLEKSGLTVSNEKKEIIKGYFLDLAKAQQETAVWTTELQLANEQAERIQKVLGDTADAERDLSDQQEAMLLPLGQARREQELRMQLIRTLEKERITKLLPEELDWLNKTIKAIAEKETRTKAMVLAEQNHVASLERQAALEAQIKDAQDGRSAPSFGTRLDQTIRQAKQAGTPLDGPQIQQAGRDLSKEMDLERANAKEQLNLQIDRESTVLNEQIHVSGRMRAEREAELRLIQEKQRLQEQGIELGPQETQDLREKIKGLQDMKELSRAGDAMNSFVDSFEVGWQQIERSGQQAYSHLEDSLLQFFKTGRLNLTTFVDFFSQEMMRLSMRFLISQGMQSMGGLGGIGSFVNGLGTFLTAGGGSGAGAEGAARAAQRGADNPALFGPGFQKGGIPAYYDIPGAQRGTVSFNERLFRISEGHTPEAIIPLQGGAVPVKMKGGGATIHAPITIITPDAAGVRRSESQIQASISRALVRSSRRLN